MRMRAVPVAAALWMILALPAAVLEGRAEPCEDCHEPGTISEGNRSVHPPFKERDCEACHLDHGDDERLVLAAGDNSLCTECHETADDDFSTAHSGIVGPRASCLSCHNPHRSRLTALLRPGRHRPLAFGRCDPCHRFDGRLHKPEVRELCFECHERDEYSRPYGHSPVVEGACLDCHDPHGSTRRALLVDGYSGERWMMEGTGDYALCLRCHDGSAFSASGTEETTEFRSGSRNIHRIHIEGKGSSGRVAPDRGLTCRNCHEPHSAVFPGLIRSQLDCGGVPCLRLEFRTINKGGECTVSCHGTKSYLRDGSDPSPFTEAPAPKPAPAPGLGEALPINEPTPLEKAINQRCRSCHEREMQEFSRTYVHLPVRQGNCSACHLDHGSDNKLVLLDREDRLCARCHDLRSPPLRTAHRGYSLQRAVCSECHNPHASGRKKLLYSLEHDPFAERDCGACHDESGPGWEIGEAINEICSGCHDDVMNQSFLHTALPKRSCKGCHRPHAADVDLFLRGEGSALCFRCHDAAAFTLPNAHPPVFDGECGACHPPHGSAAEGLFTESYPLVQYLPFDAGAFGLCWQCHDEESLTGSTEEGTNFRKGGENLHALHIRDHLTVTELGDRTSPGVTCRSCHNPHSTEGPRLILSELDCDGVPCLQLDYRKIGEGGKCVKGCHTNQSYLP